MKRAFFFTILGLLCASFLNAEETGVVTKVINRKGRLPRIEKKVFLDNIRFNIAYSTENNVDTVRKRWGDQFFGMEFLGRYIGSWSPWNFLSVIGKVDGKKYWLVEEKVPQKVYAFVNHGVAQAQMIFPAPKKGRMILRFMKFPSHPDWVFLRMTVEEFQLENIAFNAYPGSSNNPPDREHWLATRTREVKIQEQAAFLTPQEHYLAFYNKYIQTQAGCFFIYDPEQFVKRYIPRAGGQGTGISLEPRKDVKQFFFALGRFAFVEAEKAVPKFIGEDADAVEQFMKNINWELELPADEMERTCQIARKFGVEEEKLQQCRTEFLEASGRKEITEAMASLKKLKELKKAAVEKGLQQFR